MNKEKRRSMGNYDLIYRICWRTAVTHNVDIFAVSDAHGVLREKSKNKEEIFRFDPNAIEGHCRVLFQNKQRNVTVSATVPMNIFNGDIDNDRVAIRLVCEKLDKMISGYHAMLAASPPLPQKEGE